MTRCPSGPQARLARSGSNTTATMTATGLVQRRILALRLLASPRLPDDLTPSHASIAATRMSAEEEGMRGVVFTGERQLELMEFPDPTPGDGEVVIEMKASGMCGSDLHQYRRPKTGGATGGLAAPSEPTIAGHEPCGIVAAVGTGVSP